MQFRYTFKAFERMFESFKRESLGLIMCVIGAPGDASNCYDITDFRMKEKKKLQIDFLVFKLLFTLVSFFHV